MRNQRNFLMQGLILSPSCVMHKDITDVIELHDQTAKRERFVSNLKDAFSNLAEITMNCLNWPSKKRNSIQLILLLSNG